MSGFDVITDFAKGVDVLDVAGTDALVASGTVDGTNSTLTIAGSAVQSHSVDASGLASFTGASGALTVNSLSSLAAVVQYLQLNDLGDAGSTLAISGTIGGINHLYVYTQGTADGTDNSQDVLVDLVGVQLTGVGAGLAMSGGHLTVLDGMNV